MYMKRTLIIPAVVFGLLLFAACTNPLNHPPEGGGETPEITTGKGLVRVDTGTGAARTVMPAAVFDHYEYWFSDDGAQAVKIDPTGGVFELDPGTNWTVTVKAFAGPGDNTLAAEGTSAGFAVTAGQDMGTVPVTIHPVVSEGIGTLTFSLEYPAGVTLDSFTLTLLAGLSSIDLKTVGTAGGTDPITYSGTKTDIQAGYYLARAQLSKSNGTRAGKSEVVHIYQNMSSTLSWVFDDEHFTVVPVVSSADDGPGTLREALTGAQAGNMIVIDLPEHDRVITLLSPLPGITVDLTIDGNGATLTQSCDSRLLYIPSYTAQVTIRRLHFKDGKDTMYGAAIFTNGVLRIESCIFSGNSAIGNVGGSGGAINNDGDLRIESCIFSGNSSASSGGAIYSNDGDLWIESCIFSGNSTTGPSGVNRGGAIANNTGTLTVLGSTFYGNTAGEYGGAISQNSGATILTGNLFYGNTAHYDSVVCNYFNGGTVTSGGYNVSDKENGNSSSTGSGWTFNTGDTQVTTLPITPVSYKPLSGGGAINRIPARPAGYPEFDFYGVLIPASNLAAGAVQTPAEGCYLDYGSFDNGTVSIASGSIATPDADGMVNPGGIVRLEAAAGSGYVFVHWTVDGVRQPAQSPANQITITMNANKTVRGVFGRVVNSAADSGTGSLRDAITNAIDNGVIVVDGLAGQTIALSTPLPKITKSLTIEGNGIILSGSGIPTSENSPILWTTGSSTQVTLRRIHFKDGPGGAIISGGSLRIESCIFSGNSSDEGGAVSSVGTLTVLGSTFYRNTASYRGGAIYGDSSLTLTMTGNLFYGNTASSYSVVYRESGVMFTSGGYNVSDKEDGNSSSTGSGWTFANYDKQVTTQPITPVSYKPLADSGALEVIPAGSVLTDYPAVDFYGTPMTGDLAAGAVQTPAAEGYALDYGSIGNGTVDIILIGLGAVPPDADGIVNSGGIVNLAAAAVDGYCLAYWMVDGVQQPAQAPANQITLTMNESKTVQGVFGREVDIHIGADSGPGSLREALANAEDYDVINIFYPIGVTGGELTITKSLTIEGNGYNLSGSDSSGILGITNSNAKVTIRRLHFRVGKSTCGAAVWNQGELRIESCIFSENSATGPYVEGGGAIYNSGTLTVLGSTFYENTSAFKGGAIYSYGISPVFLGGNLFYRNTAPNDNVVYGLVLPLTSGGYNVSDKASGTGSNDSGWDFTTGDTQVTTMPISSENFRPRLAGNAGEAIRIVPANPLPAGFPVVDFYGNTRTNYTSGGNTAAGAAAEPQ
jgi:predicted outer membrane repeat protein